jgi:hypothetical protein
MPGTLREGTHMHKGTLAAATALSLLISGVVMAPRAEDTAGVTALSQPYVHLYADAQGVSHFKDEVLVIKPGASGPAPLAIAQTGGATLLALRRGQKEDWHRAPRRMYLVALKGMSEVTVGDGEVRRFAPGTLLLMDDTTGKGHITRAVGPEDHVALTVPAPAP